MKKSGENTWNQKRWLGAMATTMLVACSSSAPLTDKLQQSSTALKPIAQPAATIDKAENMYGKNVAEILKRLDDKNPKVREDAARELVRAALRGECFRELLYHKDALVRLSAASELWRIYVNNENEARMPGVVFWMLEDKVVNDIDVEVRRKAASALAYAVLNSTWFDIDAVPRLQPALESKDEGVVAYTAMAIAYVSMNMVEKTDPSMYDYDRVPEFLNAKNPTVRLATINAIGNRINALRMKPKRAEVYLHILKSIVENDPDEKIKEAAKGTLTELQNAR